MQITFVINDHHSHVTAGFTLDTHRLAINDIFKANLTWHLGKNWDGVRIPFAKDSPFFDFLAFLDSQGSTGWNGIRFDFTTPIIHNGDFTVSRQDDLLTCGIFHRSHASQANFTSLLRLDIGLDRLLTHATTDVERTHGQLGTRLTNALSSNDSNGHPFFDQSPGRHVHSVTTTTNTERCIACHWRTDLDLLESHCLNLTSDLRCDHLVLRNDDFVRNRIHDGLTTDTTVDRIDEADLDLLTTVDHTFGNSLGGTAVIHGDHNVLRHVSQLTSQVATVSGFQCCISQTFAGTVR